MRGRKHPPEVRAAVIAALIAGQMPIEVARAYHLDPAIITRIKKEIPPDLLQKVANKKGQELGELIAATTQGIFQAFKNFVDFLATPEALAWIKLHPPSEAATIYGVALDKGFRILAARSEAEERERDLEASAGSDHAIPEVIQ